MFENIHMTFPEDVYYKLTFWPTLFGLFVYAHQTSKTMMLSKTLSRLSLTLDSKGASP